MIDRRAFLTGAASTLAFVSSTFAEDTEGPSAAISQPALLPTEQLLYSTVRLAYQATPTTIKWGTAFFFSLFRTENVHFLVLVTNKHVVDDMKNCSFSLAARLNGGKPDLLTHIPVSIDQFEGVWIPHPSVDLAIIPVQPFLEKLNSKPFIISLDPSLIPTDEELRELMPVEQVMTVGFPGALWDDAHNLPIFHRGYTATAPYIDFKGRKEFLIDFTTWPGASGSPVLLYNEGAWLTRKGTVMGGTRGKLLGVVFGVAVQDVTGNVEIQSGPTSIAAAGRMSVPANLGACIMASQILDFEPLLVSRGLTPPPGYKMRAN
jgi:hypothetical protein